MSIRRQRAIIGHHKPRLQTAVLEKTEKEINRYMLRYNVSRSFVIAVALADYFHVEGQEQYIEPVNYNSNRQHVTHIDQHKRKRA